MKRAGDRCCVDVTMEYLESSFQRKRRCREVANFVEEQKSVGTVTVRWADGWASAKRRQRDYDTVEDEDEDE